MFEKGKSGNPNGRPKREKTITDEVRKILATEHESGITKAQAVARVWVNKAIDGDMSAAKLLVEHLEGKPVQPIAGEDGDPIKAEIAINVIGVKPATVFDGD